MTDDSAGFYAHPSALVESNHIGSGTRIWAFAHVMDGARIGERCNIGDGCFIEGGAELGNDVTVKNGVAIWDGVTIGDGVFLGPDVTLTNDLRPRSRRDTFQLGKTVLEEGCSIGANATILSGLVVGRFALVGAAAVVTRDVPSHGLVIGNPARLVGHVCVCAATLDFSDNVAQCQCGRELILHGAEVTLAGSA